MADRTPALGERTPPPESCCTCREQTGTARYCAPGRCYCGHESCPAFASYVDIRLVPIHVAKSPAATSTAWKDREGETWIDQL